MAQQDDRISVSDDEMHAYLTVYPGDTAKALSENEVLAALNEAGVTFGIRHEEMKSELPAAIKEASRSEKPRRVLVAEGQPPQPAAPEHFLPAKELTLPREHRETARRLFREAGAPRAKRTVEEQVEVRKKVPGKGLFGLGRGKDTWQTVTETRERELTGKVPLKIKDARIVSRDAAVGRISPAGSGTPGRTVKNARILPKKPADPWVYVGDYVRREGHTLIAEASGFLRIGPNWVDLVPYEAHDWQLSFSEDMADCLLTYRPGEDVGHRPTAETIIAEAKKKGYAATALKAPEEIEELLDQAVYGGTTLEQVSLSTRLDTFIDIEISGDRSKAFLHLIKGRGGGRVLDLRDVGKAVQRSGILGIDREKLKKDLIEFRRSSELELRSYLLAEGTPPTQGPDPAVDFSLRDLPEGEQNRIITMLKEHPELAGEGAGIDEFPPDSIDSIAPVEADQHVLTIAHGVPGKPGVDVFGEAIPGLPGPEPQLHLFGSLTRKGDFVLATADGVVDRCRREGHIYLRVRPHRDVAARVLLAKDQLSAQLVLTPHLGTGHRLTRERIDQILKEKSVLEGIREEAIKQALTTDEHGIPGSTTSASETAGSGSKPPSIAFLIARGRIGTPDGRPAVQFFLNIPGARNGGTPGSARPLDSRQASKQSSKQTKSPGTQGTSVDTEISATVS
ncbi:MAG: flagellar assembly protein A, partial [Spirochaetota bacterium]